MKYTIVTGSGYSILSATDDLERKVNVKMLEGFKPHEGLVIKESSEDYLVIQAMILEEKT